MQRADSCTDLFLGVDGGGTRCRARLADRSGHILGEGAAGPANIRLGLEASFTEVFRAAQQCLSEAELGFEAIARIFACLALAGASEARELDAMQSRSLPFRRVTITSDAHAACVGAHGGQDGGVIVIGTGSVGWAIVGGRQFRVGGWGLPLSDEGSAAWIGREALRTALQAYDGRIAPTPLLKRLLDEFASDPYAIVRWADAARPTELIPGIEQRAAYHIDTLTTRLIALGAERIVLAGGLAPHLESWLAPQTRQHLVAPQGDAMDGALQLARAEAEIGVEA